jgi:dephospho-CoA kinase
MQPVVVDNVSKLVSVEYLKERGFFIVGVDCPLMLRVERILNGQRGKRTDYVNDPFKLRVRMQRRDESMQVMESLRIADVVYNTELLPKDYSDVAKEILQLAA